MVMSDVCVYSMRGWVGIRPDNLPQCQLLLPSICQEEDRFAAAAQ